MAKSTESLTVEVHRNSTSQKIASFKTTTNWVRYSVTYVSSGTGDLTFKVLAAGTLYLTNVKIEQGNKVTDWTPAPEDNVTTVYTEYYLSDSATSLSGGSWSKEAPEWVDGKYMWSRNVSVDIMGNQTYTPDQNGVCIAGAKGKDAAIISSTEPSDKSYLWCDTSVSPPLLKRWADTEWVVVNDNALQITEIYNEMTSSINKASDNIMLQVGEKTYSKDEVDKLLAETNTTFEQTKDSFNFEFNRIQSAINDVSNTSDARYEDITKYIRFVDGEIHIGIVGNPIMLRQRNDRISFLENNTEVAYISNRTLYFTHAEVLKDLKIGKFACLTYSGSTLIGEKIVSFNATVPDSVVPTVDTITVTEAVDGLATKFEAFIQNKSKLKIVSSGSGAGGSTISSYSVKVLGTTYTGNDITTNYINQSGTVDIEVTATDSRGRTGTKTIQVEVLEYFTPTIKSFKAFRSGTDGKEQSGSKTLRCEYNFVIASCNEKNDNTYTIEYKASNASTWTNLTIGNKYVLSGSISSPDKLALEYSYEVRLTINDYFNTPATYTVKIGTETVPLCVYPTGKGLGIGGYPTKEALQVFMKAEFLNDVSHANTEHFQNGLTQNIQVLTGKNCKNIITSGLYYMSGGTNRPVNVDGWLEVMKYDANTVAQIYTTKTGQKYVRYMKNGIWDNNWRGGMSNVEKLWSGTLSKGGKVTIANLDLYDTFILGCSNGTAMLIGTRYYDPSGNRGTTVLFSTAHDDGTSSYVYKATTSMSGTMFTLISASTHTLQNNGNAGSSMSVKSLYGVM